MKFRSGAVSCACHWGAPAARAGAPSGEPGAHDSEPKIEAIQCFVLNTKANLLREANLLRVPGRFVNEPGTYLLRMLRCP